MNILHIIKSFDIGGIEMLCLDFCNNAHHHNIETHLICIGDGELRNEFLKSPAKISFFKKFPRPYDLIDPFLVKRIRNYIIQNKIDIIHSHFADEGLHAYFAIRNLNKPKLIQEFAVDLKINRRIDNFKFNFLSSRTSANVAPSAKMLKQILDFNMNKADNSTFVHNGIDPNRIEKKNSTLRAELNIPDNAILSGMIGNFFNNVRDQLTICKALPKIMEKHQDFHFVFVGGSVNQWIKNDDSYFNECYNFCKENKILDRTHFIGLQKDISNILSTLDFYVHSSNYDTFGIAPIEAMFFGLAVIANDIEVFKETSNNGEFFFLFKDKNPNDLAEKVDCLLKNRNQLKEIAEKQISRANSFYHINVYIKNMKNIYQKALNQ